LSSMKTRYRCFQESSGTSLLPASAEAETRDKGLLQPDAELLWEIEADTWEEAMAIRNLRMGFGPYVPVGEAQPCPKCSAAFYPEGSGQCWRCGPVC
jgi:hypothetical protein